MPTRTLAGTTVDVNDDGFFTKIKGKNAPLTTADSVQKLQVPLTEILAGWGVGKP